MMKMSLPLISVIVPIYNVEKYIMQCIESIRKQTYTNLEIILVNDCTLDNSGAIADIFASEDNRIKVIHKEKNEGVSAARNTGINASTGEYICFVDGDDYVMEDYVEYLYNLIYDDADITLTTDMFNNFNIKKQNSENNIMIFTPEQATIAILCYNIPIGVYCKLFKRDFLGEDIRFLEELFIGEGFNFNTTAFQRANHIVVGHKKIYYYRRDNPTSATTKFSVEKWENGLHAIDLINQNFILHSDQLKSAWKFAYWRTHSDAYDVLVLANAEKQYPEFYIKCLKEVRKFGIAFKVPISKQNKLRALVMGICPKAIPWAMRARRKKYRVEV